MAQDICVGTKLLKVWQVSDSLGTVYRYNCHAKACSKCLKTKAICSIFFVDLYLQDPKCSKQPTDNGFIGSPVVLTPGRTSESQERRKISEHK